MTDEAPRRRADDDLRRFVADARPDLLRTAVLPTGDPGAAEELVTRLPDGGAAVSAYDRAGRPVATVPIAPTATEPFGDYGDGP